MEKDHATNAMVGPTRCITCHQTINTREKKEHPLSRCLDPMTFSQKPQKISGVLRHICSQEGCDGGEWDVMAQAANYIDYLESVLGIK